MDHGNRMSEQMHTIRDCLHEHGRNMPSPAEMHRLAKPTVSVVMAVYNAAAYVERSVRSVIDQTFTDLELICVDDGSSDNSVEVLQVCASMDSRIRIIRNSHQGAGAALNAGLDAAIGRYVAFLDNDDAYHPRTLELAVSALQKENVDIVVWDYSEIGEDEFKVAPFAPIYHLPDVQTIHDHIGFVRGNSHIAFWCKLYRREVVADVRFETDIIHADIVFFYRLFSKSGLSVGHLPLVLHHYCVRAGSIVHSRWNERKAVDKVLLLERIRRYVQDNETIWPRIRKEAFPDHVWSIFKLMRRVPAVRYAVLHSMKRLLGNGTFRWNDLPLRRRIRMWLAFSIWHCKERNCK